MSASASSCSASTVIRGSGFVVPVSPRSVNRSWPDVHIQGVVLGTVSFPLQKEEMAEVAETFLREFPAADHPYLVEHISYHIDSGVLGEGDFEFGLDLLLDSLERLRDLAATGT